MLFFSFDILRMVRNCILFGHTGFSNLYCCKNRHGGNGATYNRNTLRYLERLSSCFFLWAGLDPARVPYLSMVVCMTKGRYFSVTKVFEHESQHRIVSRSVTTKNGFFVRNDGGYKDACRLDSQFIVFRAIRVPH